MGHGVSAPVDAMIISLRRQHYRRIRVVHFAVVSPATGCPLCQATAMQTMWNCCQLQCLHSSDTRHSSHSQSRLKVINCIINITVYHFNKSLSSSNLGANSQTILGQFSDLRQSYDSWRIHRTLMTILRHTVRQNLTNHL